MGGEGMSGRISPLLGLLLGVVVAIAVLVAVVAVADDGPPIHIREVDLTADEFQSGILADGRVTDDEMRSALMEVVGCVEDAGYDGELVRFDPGVSFHLRAGGETNEEADEADEALERCIERRAAAVSDRYFDAHR